MINDVVIEVQENPYSFQLGIQSSILSIMLLHLLDFP